MPGAPCVPVAAGPCAGRQPRRASNGQCRRAVGVMGVETAGAVGTEQMGYAHARLAQYKFQVRLPALGTHFADAAEREQIEGDAVAIDVIDYSARIEFAENEVAWILMATATVWRKRCFWYT
jgi:hypothetical protein